uniref:Tex family protein n=1 Tax=Prevotella sp. GTC17253 TaxID=3236793 RepID=A0AB33IR63_9BACT
MNLFTSIIAKTLSLPERNVEHTLQLLDEGCTIPFIARYRKEQTGSLDEVQIAAISELNDKYNDLSKRKETICKTITEQGKMTDELQLRINQCWDNNELEDIYLPYKPKRRTKAQIAREQGLESLATIILLQREQDPLRAAARFIKGDIKNSKEAIKGAQDIIAETVSEDERSRQQLRTLYRRGAIITSKIIKNKKDTEEAQKFSDYFDWQESLKRCSSHRLLAMRRGESEGVLRVSISADDTECLERLKRLFIKGFGPCQRLVEEAIEDAYKRLLKPAMENEFAALSKETADQEAIKVFVGNLRQLLLAAPLGQKQVMGVDPGFRTGCKVVCLNAQGNLLYHTVVDILPPKGNQLSASKLFAEIAKKYSCEAIAIGNGTASRETSDIIKHTEFYRPDLPVYVVSEDGASIYSASKIAREEFPDQDVTVRGAVSIARRLMDPLAELVKIDPKSIGVGQYQHDVDQTLLKKSLDQTIESCVNMVGVNLNTASRQLLTYVSGLGPTLANNIVEYRTKNGVFSSRAELKKVPRLGPAAFQQCAGFLRIPNSKNPLDNSAVHPESYGIVETMAKDNHCTVADLIKDDSIRKTLDLNRYITTERGLPTLNDIMKELEKPGRDPRNQIETFEFDERVKDIKDLEVGMELPGIVTNITNFGAFVDIGVHQDGLVHISQLSNNFIKDPNEAVHLHQHVRVKIIEIDLQRRRISLTMRI